MTNAVRVGASMLDLRPLYYFVHVAECGSFSRASASLSVSQPILSRAIKQLEVGTRVQLLYRNGRGVGLTEAGERLFEHGQQILRSLSQAHLEVAALRGTPIGMVSLALPPLLGSTLSAELVRRMKAEHPLVSITLREGFSAEALDWLGSGTVDVAVLFNPPHIATLLTEHVYDDSIHLVGTPGSLEVADGGVVPMTRLAGLPLILPPKPHRLRSLIDTAAHDSGVELTVGVEVTGSGTTLELVRKRIGYTVLPSILLREEVADGRLSSWRIEKPDIATRLFVATSMQRPQTLATKALLRMVTEIFAVTLSPSPQGYVPPTDHH